MGGTENLLRLSEYTGVKRFVYLSSNSVVGVSRDPDVVFDEKTEGRPYLNYGRSKKLAEDAVRSAADRGRIETGIVRAPWFYGPHQPDRQTLFFTMIKTGRVPLVGPGTNRRSMVYVDNLCQGLMLAATSPAARNQTYWIADQRPYTMNEIVSTVADVLEQDFGMPVKRGAIHLPAIASDVAFVADSALQAVGDERDVGGDCRQMDRAAFHGHAEILLEHVGDGRHDLVHRVGTLVGNPVGLISRGRRCRGEHQPLTEVVHVDHRPPVRARSDERHASGFDHREEQRLAVGLVWTVEPRCAHDPRFDATA